MKKTAIWAFTLLIVVGIGTPYPLAGSASGETETPTVVAEISKAGNVAVLNERDNQLYVANFRGGPGNGPVHVIDCDENRYRDSIDVSQGGGAMEFGEQANQIYVLTLSGMDVIDAKTHDVVHTFPAAYIALAVSEASGLLYGVPGFSSPPPWPPIFPPPPPPLDVIDSRLLEVQATVELGFAAGWSADAEVDDVTGHLYVAHYESKKVWDIDIHTNEVVGVVRLNSRPTDLLVNPKLGRLYVVGDTGNVTSQVDILATQGMRPISKIPISGDRGRLALHNASGRVFVTAGVGMYVISGHQDRLLKFVEGNLGWAIDINQKTGRVYVSSFSSPRGLAILDATGNLVIETTVELRSGARSIVVNPNNNLVYAGTYSADGHITAVISDPVHEASLDPPEFAWND